MAIGGGFPAAFGGGPTGSTASGVPMLVDYVAAYTTGGGGSPPPPPPPPPGRSAITNANGLCLDDRSSSTANGNPIQIYTCNGTGAQQWTVVVAGSTLHVLGKCLDITGGGTANGTKVQLYDCNNTGAQVWIPQSNGSL